jgi:hypothetical protein
VWLVFQAYRQSGRLTGNIGCMGAERGGIKGFIRP